MPPLTRRRSTPLPNPRHLRSHTRYSWLPARRAIPSFGATCFRSKPYCSAARGSRLSPLRYEFLDALEDWLFWLQLFLERRLVWTPKVTSQFFVPGCQTTAEARLKAHTAAYSYFDVQRSALLLERDMEPSDVEMWHDLYRHNREILPKAYAEAHKQLSETSPASTSRKSKRFGCASPARPNPRGFYKSSNATPSRI